MTPPHDIPSKIKYDKLITDNQQYILGKLDFNNLNFDQLAGIIPNSENVYWQSQL
ncbi:hypothetical protein Hanom_Chr01g00011171 [Helianthus anomalus]